MMQEVDVDPGLTGGRLADEERDAGAAGGVGPERRSEVRGDVRADREERHVAEVEQPGEADDDVQAQRHDHVGRREDHVVQALLPSLTRSGRMAAAPKATAPRAARDLRGAPRRSRALQRATALLAHPAEAWRAVVRAVLRPVAADRHRAPRRRSVLRAVEERVPALAAALHARPVAAELRLVEDAEQRRHGTVDAARSGLERGPARVVDGDAEPSAGRGPANDLDAPPGPDRSPWFAIASARMRFPQLAQAGRVGLRDPVAGRHEPLLAQPRLRPSPQCRCGPSRAAGRGCGS